jgi:uncharacterized membrane protein (UPF0127 family)
MLHIRFIAKKPQELAKGLMFSEPLKKDECAMFVFNHMGDHSFWNKNVSYPISLLFLDENFKIQNIGFLEAEQEKPCRANFPLTKYVIEGHKDLPAEKNIKLGDFCFPEKNKIKIVQDKQKSY